MLEKQKINNNNDNDNDNNIRSFSRVSLDDNVKPNIKISKYMTIENDIDSDVIKEIIDTKQNIHKELKLHNNKIYEKSYEES